MSALVEGDDGLPAEEVGAWTKEKHERLRRYLDISRAARNKFLTGPSKSATFIDLFCGPGRGRVKETGEWIDGSAVAAWKISQENGAPFSKIYVADIDIERRAASAERLRRLKAPIHELTGSAADAALKVATITNRFGLHVAFLDPFSLGALHFEIIKSLARLKRMDMLIHVSAMDLQRNLTEATVLEAVDAARRMGVGRADILGFEFEMGLTPRLTDEAKAKGVAVALRYIPKDVFDKRAVDKGLRGTLQYPARADHRAGITTDVFRGVGQGAGERARNSGLPRIRRGHQGRGRRTRAAADGRASAGICDWSAGSMSCSARSRPSSRTASSIAASTSKILMCCAISPRLASPACSSTRSRRPSTA